MLSYRVFSAILHRVAKKTKILLKSSLSMDSDF